MLILSRSLAQNFEYVVVLVTSPSRYNRAELLDVELEMMVDRCQRFFTVRKFTHVITQIDKGVIERLLPVPEILFWVAIILGAKPAEAL